ncbi:hypothetical protein CA13_31280 [Planctomycetes bacterium CA13]|uniref:Uncharacterized protein n=1 Tax=Novipirellula herctigrandis TaxID=2527986 RepID=A0A5C5Z2Q4_9BACT|nr:hypothetical protein CA13_31150 [Planctomycetes bacterium CA13]TWT81668.1 hypothetical protein CA13_31210 [Planctomycetes bacterium CA13]TWT81675.1 hypothetical protein CA13_31280 [Planctomycetes bacterium CA13]
MKLYITRDSVAAGDDVDAPHARNSSVPDDADVSQIVAACLAASPLPSIAGGDASWALSSGVPLAVIAQQWASPKLVSQFPPNPNRLDLTDGTLRLHFTYFAQQSPDDVFAVLERLRLHAQ